jgi:rSAM/selenodomain-associated transferase 1
MAKAPVPGQVKTRLAVSVGDEAAAELAADCLLDTLDVCEAVFSRRDRMHVALAGDLEEAARHDELAERLGRWTVHRQRGSGFARRLTHAHTSVGRATAAPVVQIGMDTPHLCADELADVVRRLGRGNDAVLGPAEDGGWWVLGVTSAGVARCLAGVEMSTERTYTDTLAALEDTGARVDSAGILRDVDTAEDAALVAAAAPWTRFASSWSRVSAR